jgi:DNA-binding SARP family transcriptional activator
MLMEALQLYGGELLPGFHVPDCAEFDRWLDDERAAARERAAAATWALAQRLESDNQLSNAAAMARRSVRLTWTDERALRRALSMLDRLGDRAGAARLYDEFATRLMKELEVHPSDETARLMAGIRGDANPRA